MGNIYSISHAQAWNSVNLPCYVIYIAPSQLHSPEITESMHCEPLAPLRKNHSSLAVETIAPPPTTNLSVWSSKDTEEWRFCWDRYKIYVVAQWETRKDSARSSDLRCKKVGQHNWNWNVQLSTTILWHHNSRSRQKKALWSLWMQMVFHLLLLLGKALHGAIMGNHMSFAWQSGKLPGCIQRDREELGIICKGNGGTDCAWGMLAWLTTAENEFLCWSALPFWMLQHSFFLPS